MPKITFNTQRASATFRVTDAQIKAWRVMKTLGVPFHGQIVPCKKIKSRQPKWVEGLHCVVKHNTDGTWTFVGEPK